jgi:hypothetical protein
MSRRNIMHEQWGTSRTKFKSRQSCKNIRLLFYEQKEHHAWTSSQDDRLVKIKTKAYLHAHFCKRVSYFNKASAVRASRLPDQLWALSWASVSFIPSPPSLPQKHLYRFSDLWYRAFERSSVLKRLALLNWVGLMPTRWRRLHYSPVRKTDVPYDHSTCTLRCLSA